MNRLGTLLGQQKVAYRLYAESFQTTGWQGFQEEGQVAA
jgi:hypothetical protein